MAVALTMHARVDDESILPGCELSSIQQQGSAEEKMAGGATAAPRCLGMYGADVRDRGLHILTMQAGRSKFDVQLHFNPPQGRMQLGKVPRRAVTRRGGGSHRPLRCECKHAVTPVPRQPLSTWA